MKNILFRGWKHVFRFTLRDICSSKGWFLSTLIIGLMLVLGIPLVLSLIVLVTNKTKTDEKENKIKSVFVCDQSANPIDFAYLKTCGKYDAVNYTAFDSVDSAISAISSPNDTLILQVSYAEDTYFLTTYIPDNSEIKRSDAYSFCSFVEDFFMKAKIQKSGIDETSAALVSTPITADVVKLSAEGEEISDENEMSEMVSVMLPLLVVMLVYMMVLLYGQAVGNTILLEKSNKLMDTMLTSVHPFALVLGKLLAVSFSAVLQFVVWIFALVGGSASGSIFAIALAPAENTDSGAAGAIKDILIDSSMLSVSGVIMAIIIFSLGCFLYLSIATISGALASKSEDLGKTNYIFVLLLIFSFFLCLGSPESTDSILVTSPWMNYFPFTALLVLPGQLLLGKASIETALISGVITLIFCGIFIYIAAGIYKLLVLYRGNPPTPKQLLEMFKTAKSAKDVKGGNSHDIPGNQ